MHKLILILGTGQGVLEKHLAQNYRLADYYFPNDPEKIFSTPFIGEAIIKGEKSSFDQIFILGTKNSMWETLFDRAIGADASDNEIEQFSEIADSIKQNTLSNNSPLIRIIGDKLSEVYGIETLCKIIPVGKDEDELWGTFNEIINIPQFGDTLSIDITHGLRYQPMILTIALFYLQSLKNIKIENVYYGALELSKSYYEGKTPIMNLSTLTNMVTWTNAAFSFSKYGDTSVFSTCMNSSAPEDFLKTSIYFSNVLQLNTVGDIRANAKNFISKSEHIDLETPINKPFSYVKTELQKFPKEVVATNTDWELMLLLSERHWNNGQLGLSILAAWEALMEKLSEIYGIDVRNDFAMYRQISINARIFKPTKIIAGKISEFRNAIAHAETDKCADPNLIITTFPYWFSELKKVINSSEILEIKKRKPLKNINDN